MSNAFWWSLIVVLLVLLVGLSAYILAQQRRMARVVADSRYREGLETGRNEVMGSIRYEQEIFDTRRSGLVKKETLLKVRERVMLGNLRIAEMEREIVLSSEVNEQNVWSLLEQARSFVVQGVPAAAAVERIIAPAARNALTRGRGSSSSDADST